MAAVPWGVFREFQVRVCCSYVNGVVRERVQWNILIDLATCRRLPGTDAAGAGTAIWACGSAAVGGDRFKLSWASRSMSTITDSEL